MPYKSSEGSDEPGQMPRLIRALAASTHKIETLRRAQGKIYTSRLARELPMPVL